MKPTSLALTAALLVIGTTAAQAESSSAKMDRGTSSPGHQMQNEGSPGASEYAPGRQSENRPNGPSDTPGHQMQNDTGPGASQYAPGHNKADDNRKN